MPNNTYVCVLIKLHSDEYVTARYRSEQWTHREMYSPRVIQVRLVTCLQLDAATM